MLARSTCAVQIFDVAFSRRICCSRVCNARRRAGRPASSTLTPTSRPGIERASFSETAINAAWGPPPPIGTPNRCAEPIAMSAPIEPAERRSTAASGSMSTTQRAPLSCTVSITDDRSRIPPVDDGKEKRAPNTPSSAARVASSPDTTEIPVGSARVCRTARICG